MGRAVETGAGYHPLREARMRRCMAGHYSPLGGQGRRRTRPARRALAALRAIGWPSTGAEPGGDGLVRGAESALVLDAGPRPVHSLSAGRDRGATTIR